MLDKIGGKKKNGYIVGSYPCANPIPLLLFKNHWMLYEENVTFNGVKYKNNYRMLLALIESGILREITMKDKAVLESQLEAYITKPHEINLAEHDPNNFNFLQYIPSEPKPKKIP